MSLNIGDCVLPRNQAALRRYFEYTSYHGGPIEIISGPKNGWPEHYYTGKALCDCKSLPHGKIVIIESRVIKLSPIEVIILKTENL